MRGKFKPTGHDPVSSATENCKGERTCVRGT